MKDKRLFLTILGIIFIIGFPHAILSQLSVIATIPADGAINIEPTVTFKITFNAPLDTSVRFDYPQNFFLSLAIQPDTLMGAPDSITLSPDLKTVYVHNLHLWSDTKYLLFIDNAVSATHDSLSLPYLATFTTGASLPTATVSGKVSSSGADATGTAVMLLNAPLFSEQEAEVENATIIPTSAGNYTIKYVSSGTYWPVAVKDYRIDAAGDLEPNVGGSMGFYDPDVNGLPDSIVISEGQQMSGINMAMFSLAPVTARQNYATVEVSARSWASDATLVQLGAQEISPSGKAMGWMYAFYSPTLAAYRTWVAMGALVMPMEMEELPETTTALPTNWLDSDVVADSAEARGGSSFRALYPDVTIQAFLSTVDLPGGSLSFSEQFHQAPRSLFSRQFVTRFMSEFRPRHFEQAGVALQNNLTFMTNSRAAWVFFYTSAAAGKQQVFVFDALTGKYIELPQPAETTARFNLAAANQAAQNWAADAALIMVGTHQSNLTSAGEAEMWFYIYHSASQDSEQVFFFSNGMSLGQGPIWEPPSKVALPSTWKDSDVAIDTAEIYGGSEYRIFNQNVVVDGGVSRGLLPDQPDRAVWQFCYTSSAAAQLTIYVDAVTGKYIELPHPAETTARFNLAAANQSAQAWSSDAELVWVQTHQSNLSPDGKAEMWFYAYYSASLDSGQAFFFSNGMQAGQMGGELPYKQALPSNWLDSDAAIDTAETYGGSQYRATNQDVWVSGGIAEGLFPSQPSRAVWFFNYNSSTAQQWTIYIDALTGQPVTEPSYDLTAQFRLSEVEQTARSWAGDAVLTSVGAVTPMESNGRSGGWVYIYYSATKSEYRNFYATVAGPISSEPLQNARPASNESLPSSWVDSDVATAVAETNGGSAYRASNSGVILAAVISKNMLEYYSRPSKAVWRFMYGSSTGPHLIIMVDAETGALIPNSIPISTAARYNLEAANFVATGFSADARLTYVMNNAGPMDAKGKADAWLFTFYSASKNSFASYQMMSGYLVFVWSADGGLGSQDELPANWLNSDQVAAISESNGGSQFRASHSDARLQGLLTLNYPGEKANVPPTTAVWRMLYGSASADLTLGVLINAVTGEIISPITGISDRDNQVNAIPDKFALNQNYPNPFNSETVIEYQLPQASDVEISIFNLQGQKVTTLVRDYQTAGYYKVTWTGIDESGQSVVSSIYFYQLKAGNFTAVKKMLLLR